MKKLKNKKGITLIALVVTIVVLLILAGTAIAMLTGDNGIIKKAQLAKKLTEESSEKEKLQLIMQMYHLQKENEKNFIGTKLYDRNVTNGNNWSIIMIKDTKETYGDNWRYIQKGTDLLEYGKAENNWLYNEETGEIIQLEEENYLELAYGANLAVKDGLVFNLDPLNMEDENSWGSANLYGFNGTETDENGNVISGFSKGAFYFDGVDDYIEVYSNSDFSKDGITIETYGEINGKSILGNIYKGPTIPSSGAFKYSCGNRNCSIIQDNIYFQVGGTFSQSGPTGTIYQCPKSHCDFHIPLNNNKIYNGEAYVTFSLKADGTFLILLNGKKIIEDKFDADYALGYKEYLKNTDYPIIIGKSSFGSSFFGYYKIKTYAIRIYNKALSEEEAIENCEKTIAYRDLSN